MWNVFVVFEEAVVESFDFWAWLSQYLSPEVIASVISVITAITCVLKLAGALKSLAKEKTLTTQDVCNEVQKTLETTNKEIVEKEINEMIQPLEKEIKQITPTLNAFAKVLALSQENTPESRLAILELLQEIGSVGNEVIEEAKDTIEKEIEENNKSQEETNNTLDTIVSENASESESETEGRV